MPLFTPIISFRRTARCHGSPKTDDLGEIARIATLNGKIYSVGSDSTIRVSDTQLNCLRTCTVGQTYITALLALPSGIMVGYGSGKVEWRDEELQIKRSVSICTDCVSDIICHEEGLVAVSYGGVVAFLARDDLATKRTIQLGCPITQVVSFDGKLYTAGTRSFTIGQQIEEVPSTRQFFTHQKQLYASRNGEGVVSAKGIWPIEADLFVSVADRLLGFSDSFVCQLLPDQSLREQLLLVSSKAKYAVTCAAVMEGKVALGDENGHISLYEVRENQ